MAFLAKMKTTKAVAKKTTQPKKPRKIFAPLRWIAKPFRPIGRYLKGSWQELRQVRWPNRRATWSLTSAVVLFSGFFFLFIVLLDDLFKLLFQLIIK